jgi:hypothetical protein
MGSPRNPLNRPLGERTAAVYTTIYILNQLLLIEPRWIEKGYTTTSKDGVAFLINNKSIATVLVEFSGENKLLYRRMIYCFR